MSATPPTATPVKAGPLKKIPTPILIAAGGGVIGIGYAVLRDKNKPDTAVAGSGAGELDPGAIDGQADYIPQSVAYTGPSVDSSAGTEAAGAIGTTSIQTIGEIFGALVPALVGARQPASPDLETILGRVPVGGAAPVAAPVQTPAPAAPALTEAQRLPAAYTRSSTLRDGNLSKGFPGALGFARIGSGGAGAAHYIDYHIRFSGYKLQRWRCLPNAKGGPKWSMIWSGSSGGAGS